MKLTKLVSVFHPNGFISKEHTHAQHEMVYCVKGTGNAFIRDQKKIFSTGNYYLVRSGTPHVEQDHSATDIIYFHFEAPSALVPEGVHTDFNGAVLHIVKKIRTEANCNLFRRSDMITALLTQLLIESERSLSHPERANDITSAIQYINENVGQDINLKKLADQYNYSYDRFRHILKNELGIPPYQYILNQRIEKAKLLLSLNPKSSITDIATVCGFNSSSQFSNLFRAKMKMTPKQYMTECQQRDQKG